MSDDVLKYMSSYLSYFDLASSSESAGRQAGSQSCSATAWWHWVMAHMALTCTAWPRARTHLAWTGWLRRPKKKIRRFYLGILKASFLWISESIFSILFPSQDRLDSPLLVASIHPEHVEPGETTVLRTTIGNSSKCRGEKEKSKLIYIISFTHWSRLNLAWCPDWFLFVWSRSDVEASPMKIGVPSSKISMSL